MSTRSSPGTTTSSLTSPWTGTPPRRPSSGDCVPWRGRPTGSGSGREPGERRRLQGSYFRTLHGHPRFGPLSEGARPQFPTASPLTQSCGGRWRRAIRGRRQGRPRLPLPGGNDDDQGNRNEDDQEDPPELLQETRHCHRLLRMRPDAWGPGAPPATPAQCNPVVRAGVTSARAARGIPTWLTHRQGA